METAKLAKNPNLCATLLFARAFPRVCQSGFAPSVVSQELGQSPAPVGFGAQDQRRAKKRVLAHCHCDLRYRFIKLFLYAARPWPRGFPSESGPAESSESQLPAESFRMRRLIFIERSSGRSSSSSSSSGSSSDFG